MIRIAEKLLFKKKPGDKDQRAGHELSKTIKTTLEKEEEGYKKRITETLNSKDNIEFTISDMLRGKCIFLTVDDILLAIANIKGFVEKNNKVYEIVEI